MMLMLHGTTTWLVDLDSTLTHPLMMVCFHLHDFPFGTIHGANDCILTQHMRGCKGTDTHHSYTDQCGLALICSSQIGLDPLRNKSN